MDKGWYSSVLHSSQILRPTRENLIIQVSAKTNALDSGFNDHSKHKEYKNEARGLPELDVLLRICFIQQAKQHNLHAYFSNSAR